jgi:hypothetical protein
MMGNAAELEEALARDEYHWIVAESAGEIVGSVVYRYDRVNALAKVFGAVVEPRFRGANLTEAMMKYGYDSLLSEIPPIEVVYATTRTVSPAPQKLTANLGYKKLGIFPNVHKTEGYETHCLTALFTQSAFESRFTDFSLHPSVAPLYEIARGECGLSPLPVASQEKMRQIRSAADLPHPTNISLEFIQAPAFVRHRFLEEKRILGGHHWFYPFHEPNLLLTSADQSIEVFCFFSPIDKHCILIGIRDTQGEGTFRILDAASKLLHDLGARYIEFIIRADEIEKIEMAIEAEFIPCAYFPSMHRNGEIRHDFVAFSRSFEILNFRNLKLEGVNRQYLVQYFNIWKEQSFLPLADPLPAAGLTSDIDNSLELARTRVRV